MSKKRPFLYAFIGLLFLFSALGAMFRFKILANTQENFISPLVKKSKELIGSGYKTELADNNYLSILILGVDRRYRTEAYRTDVMILAIINKENNKTLLVSVPRDLWYGGGRLNALFFAEGWESTQRAFGEITGYEPERFILTDFADFSWIVDSMGGVPVEVETTFTDTDYPVDETFGYQTVAFTKGYEKMTGERALIFARSRKGDFDNGDWGRMKRQHLLLKGFLDAAVQPESFVCGLTKNRDSQTGCEAQVTGDTLVKAFETITTAKMDTNLQVKDLEYVWDLYKDRGKYGVMSLLMDDDFVYSPPMEQYGGAWVLVPAGGDYSLFHEAIQQKLSGIEPEPEITEAEDPQNVTP